MAKLTNKQQSNKKKKQVKIKLLQEVIVPLDSFSFYDKDTDVETPARDANEIASKLDALAKREGHDARDMLSEFVNLYSHDTDWELVITDVI